MKDSFASRFLAAMALVAVGVYCLSCKPAWSPDGTKVAYLCAVDADGGEVYGVAVYDIASKANTCVFESSRADRKRDMAPVEVYWPRGGNEVYWLTASEDGERLDQAPFRVSAHDVETGKTRVVREMTAPGIATGTGLLPSVLWKGRWLWCMAAGDEDEGLSYRIDLKTGDVVPLAEPAVVVAAGRKLFYYDALEGGTIHVGRISTWFGFRQKRLFAIPNDDDADITPILAVPRDVVRFAVLKKKDGIEALEVFNKRGEKVASVKWSDPVSADDEMGGAAWSHDGTKLWLAAEIGNPDGTSAPGFAEIDTVTRLVRPIRIDQRGREDELVPLHLSLSPDGTMLAASGVEEELWSLILVDLSKEDRPVTLVDPPSMPGARREGAL